MKLVCSRRKMTDVHSMKGWVCIVPLWIAAFKPVDESWTFAHIIVTACKLYGESILTVLQLDCSYLAQSLWQNNVTWIASAYCHLVTVDIQLGEEHAGCAFHARFLYWWENGVQARRSAEQNVSVFCHTDWARIEIARNNAVRLVVVWNRQREFGEFLALDAYFWDSGRSRHPNIMTTVNGHGSNHVACQSVMGIQDA